VVDPLGHCQEAADQFHGDLIAGRVVLPVLLSVELFNGTFDQGAVEGVDHVTFYVMGPNYWLAPHRGNFWTTLPTWPTPTSTKYYFTDSGALTTTVPGDGAASFMYDPSDPCPSIGGNNLEIACGPKDQRPLENRSDVLVFTTDELTDDVCITGPLIANLAVSTANANDTDWVVRLTDVYPESHGGGSHLIQDGIIRMRWRNFLNNPEPEPIVPGQVYPVTVNLWNTSYVFNKGHKIRVTVTSSNSPRFSTNSNLGLPLAHDNQTIPTEYIVANNTLHLGSESYIDLPIVPLSSLPKFDVKSTVDRAIEKMSGGDSEVAAKMLSAIDKFAEKLGETWRNGDDQ